MRAALLLALLPSVGVADDLADTHFRMNFCYQQTFEASDLAANPEQKIRRIAVGRKPVGVTEHLGEVTMEVAVTLLDGASPLEGVARCHPNADGLTCDLGRGSGGFELKAQGADLALTTAGPDGMVFQDWTDEVRLGSEEGADQSFLLRRCG
ncbi:hypothetical protein Rumeso_02160 [Rubellimicrobium mesophilum DSM 19309]|uniref:DUF3617 family protein n=1 Tax=Rubellimicrobium mesophilum DSM 19309 TaxID=442562 RepID=A0A017HPC5_9RHOB|nr:hypothetical protein [Rubellimicrobium mesophilum]EYD76236.1 hypothetical protein Rumeso_02160 [Rubellimicrobium mesophilum DSM 19309]